MKKTIPIGLLVIFDVIVEGTLISDCFHYFIASDLEQLVFGTLGFANS